MRRPSSVQQRISHLRVVVSSLLLSLALAALSVAGVLADGGDIPHPH